MKCFVKLAVISLLVISLAGCGGTSNEKTVEAMGLLSSNELSIKLNNQRGFMPPKSNGVNFVCKDGIDVEELHDQLADDSDVTFINGGYVFQIKSDNSTYDYYYIRSLERWSLGLYVLSNMAGNIISEHDDGMLLLPFHLICDERINQEIAPNLLTEVEYESEEGVDEFYDFYESGGWYEVEKEGNRIRLLSYKTEPSGWQKLVDKFPIIIEFSEHLNQKFFTIQYERE